MSSLAPRDVVAHGLGGGGDLPLPPELAIAGGTAALTVSFAILLLAWRRPRFDDANAGATGRAVPKGLAAVLDSRWLARALMAFGLVAFAYIAVAAVLGQDLLINPVFGVGYVLLWVGIVPASLLFGPAFRAISPARTLHLLLARATRVDPGTGTSTYPARWGYWPAAVGLFAFVWMELVYPYSTELSPFRLWFAGYLAVMVVGSAVFGSRWLERADPFEVYSTLVGHLSVWGRDDDGTLVWRSPLRNLARVRGEPGLVAAVAVLLGSTAYDSFREANVWVRFTQSFEGPVTLLDTAVLLAAIGIVGLTFSAATMATGVDAARAARRSLPGVFAHAVVPIIVGYMVAHYLTFFVEYGQQTLIQLSDPLSRGDNLLGTADWEVDYWLSNNPSVLATIKVLAIVTGHVLGVVAAHDKAIQVLPARHHATGQLPLLFAMVLYTFGGLYLLFGV
ncbi:MAG: hypothetical protein LH468_02475 [Nocardioides sp.]|nr:hypothetical protein [Nocardioides sp.]